MITGWSLWLPDGKQGSELVEEFTNIPPLICTHPSEEGPCSWQKWKDCSQMRFSKKAVGGFMRYTPMWNRCTSGGSAGLAMGLVIPCLMLLLHQGCLSVRSKCKLIEIRLAAEQVGGISPLSCLEGSAPRMLFPNPSSWDKGFSPEWPSWPYFPCPLRLPFLPAVLPYSYFPAHCPRVTVQYMKCGLGVCVGFPAPHLHFLTDDGWAAKQAPRNINMLGKFQHVSQRVDRVPRSPCSSCMRAWLGTATAIERYSQQ